MDTRLAHITRAQHNAAVYLAAHPGDVSARLAADLLEYPRTTAANMLGDLTDAGITTSTGPGRYRVRQQLRAELEARASPAQRARVQDRAAAHYRIRAAAVGHLVNPHRWRVDTEGLALATRAQEHGQEWFRTPEEALSWAATELPGMVAVCEVLADLDRDEPWMLCDHMGPYMLKRADQGAVRHLYALGLKAARTTENRAAEALMLQRTASVGADTGVDDPGRAAYELYQQAGHEEGMASALEQTGGALLASGDLDGAAATFADSENRHRNLRRERGACIQERKWGQVRQAQGHPEEASRAYVHAHETLLDLPDGPDTYQATRSIQAMLHTMVEERGNDPICLAAAQMLAREGLHNAERTGMVHQAKSLRDVLQQIESLQNA